MYQKGYIEKQSKSNVFKIRRISLKGGWVRIDIHIGIQMVSSIRKKIKGTMKSKVKKHIYDNEKYRD